MSTLVAVELQLRSDLLFHLFHGKMDRIQHQVHRLIVPGLVGHNTPVIEVTDHRQIQHTLFGVDVRDIRHPFGVSFVRLKLSI